MSTDNLPAQYQASALPAWVSLLAPIAQLAESIAGTDFVPQAMRGNPAAVTACILTGHELGIGPMESLRSVYIIKGQTALYAKLIRKMYLAAGHKLWSKEMSNTRVTFCAHRADEPNKVTEITWTMDDVRKAGLSNNPSYTKFPRQMLTARCTAEICNLVAPDALAGLPAVEELDGERPEDVPAEAPQKPTPARKAQRAPIDAPVAPKALSAAQTAPAEPDEAPLPPLPGEDEPPADPIVSDKWAHGWFAKAGEIDGGVDDDLRHALVMYGTDGRTTHIREVRASEANAVRDALATFAAGGFAITYDGDGELVLALVIPDGGA